MTKSYKAVDTLAPQTKILATPLLHPTRTNVDDGQLKRREAETVISVLTSLTLFVFTDRQDNPVGEGGVIVEHSKVFVFTCYS